MKIIKRNGNFAEYDAVKIQNAVAKSFAASEEIQPQDVSAASRQVMLLVEARLEEMGTEKDYSVEMIQDYVEDALMSVGYHDTARSYILYRKTRENIRNVDNSLLRTLDKIITLDSKNSEDKRSNANVDGDTPMGTMLQIGSAASNAYYDSHLLTPEQSEAHSSGKIHIHDKDFYNLTLTCCQIDFLKLAEGGFGTGHGYLREPSSIGSYAALAAIAIQSNQNDQHGGQSIPNFDRAMAVGVAKSFVKAFKARLTDVYADCGLTDDAAAESVDFILKSIDEKPALVNTEEFYSEWAEKLATDFRCVQGKAFDFSVNSAQAVVETAHMRAEKEVEKLTHQAMEGFIHNLNTMHSRAGAQTPFSSINYGTDTTPEGRMVIRNVLKATIEGLGNGETPIFPIQVFRVKEGINYNEGDLNYDLFKLACECSAKRLFPNFSFQDAQFNMQYYDPARPETEISYMGCRTRVIANINDPGRQITHGRGNCSFTSINLPRIAIDAKGDEYAFYLELDRMLELVKRQLLDRFEIQSRRKVKNFPFLMGQGVWMDSEKLGPEDEIGEVIKHGTLSLGFIGLAEALKALYGKHHGESAEIQEKGLAIIKHMRQFCDKAAAETRLNITLIATPAEGLSGRFTKIDRKKYGIIEGVTDRDYYTNSYHVPVYFKLTAYDKIQIEAPYHALTNAGHISYVELDGDPLRNLDAFEQIVRCMKESGIGYGSINHPVDRDPVCGYTGIINDVCPKCGRNVNEGASVERIRRITGYLVGEMNKWNAAKVAEEADRVKHQ